MSKDAELTSDGLKNAGHDDVDVPQVRNLTVEDWESGTLDTDVWSGATAEASVQSSTVESGSYALQIAGGSASTHYNTYSHSGLETYPQAGDEFTVYAYLTDTDDRWYIFFGLQDAPSGNTFPNDMYFIEIRAVKDELQLYARQGGSQTTVFPAQSADISSHLNEWLEVNVEWGIDGDFTVTLTDASGAELASGSGTDTTWTEGGVGYNCKNETVAPTVYFDTHTLTRRSPEYTSENVKGTTELGNEVTPSGAIHTGPLESNTNALRQEYATAPVNSEATQGDKSLLTLLKSGVNPAMYMERTFDGQGGAYGHQLEAALGRFARINANLSWEYDTLVDVPNWESARGDNSVWTFNVNGRPRRLHVESDGSNTTNYDFGAIMSLLIVTSQSLGGFRITFHNVSFTENSIDNGLRIGVSDISDGSSDTLASGNGIIYRSGNGGNHELITINSGTKSLSKISDPGWGSNHDVTLEYDGSGVRLLIDGVEKATQSYSVNADFQIIFQLFLNTNNTNAETIESELITTEPLPEVLQ